MFGRAIVSEITQNTLDALWKKAQWVVANVEWHPGATDVRRRPVADRSAAGAACAGMTSASQLRRAMRERHDLVQAKRRVSAPGRRQPPASIALCSRGGFAVAQAGQKRDLGLE